VTACRECRRPVRGKTRHDLCGACYQRWRRAGRPEGIPVPFEARRGRVEDFAELTRDRGLPLAAAAERLGVHFRTAQRYDAKLRAAS